MFLVLLILQLVSSFFINKDELKIFDQSLAQTSGNQLLNTIYKEQYAGQIDAEDQIISIASLSQTFNQTIHVAILALNNQSTYTVYTLYYNKLELKLFTINRYTHQYIGLCNSIAFDQEQYILACGQNYQFQNGTRIKLNYLELQNTIYFQSHQNGFIAITENYIFYFNFDFQLIRQQLHKAQAFLVTQLYLYLAQHDNIIIQNIQEENDVEDIRLECNQSIKSFAVFQDYLYVQCEQLKRIDYTGKIVEFNQSNISSLSQTRKFLIIDNKIAFNTKYHTQTYQATEKIQPINFEDQLIYFKKKDIYIIQLLDLSIISAKDAKDTFQIGKLKFTVLEYGLQAVKSIQQSENNLQQPQTQIFYYNDYAIGNDLIVGGDGKDLGYLEKQLDNKQLSTDNLLSVIKYQFGRFAFFFLEEQTIYADICYFNKINIEYNCFDSYIFTQIKSPLKLFQAVYDQITDQFVVAFSTAETKGLHIFIDDNLYVENDDVNNVFLGQEFLVIIKKQSQQWIEIFRLQIQIFELEAKLFIDQNITQIAFGSDEIYILDSNNQVTVLADSIYGWQLVFIQKFNQTIVSIQYSENQLIVISDKEILLFSQQKLRGVVQHNLKQPKLFYQTDRFIYISNSTHLIQFTFNQEQALSNSILRIIQQKLNTPLFIVSDFQLELLIFNNKVIGLQDQKQFQISTQAKRDDYFKLLQKSLKFSNSFNQSLGININVVGTQLELRVIPYSLETLLKPLNMINVNDIFDGPISNIYIKESQKAYLKLMISINNKMAPYLTQNKINDLIYFSNNQNKILLFHSQLLQICVLNQECQTLKIIEDQKCKYLDQAQEYAFVICQNYLLHLKKSTPNNLIQFNTTFDKMIKLRFDQNYIAIYGQQNQTKSIIIYENFKQIYQNQSNELQDFLILNKTLYQLKNVELIIVDANLKIVSIKLLDELSKYEESKLFIDTQFRQISCLSNDNYLITTNNGPIFQVQITQDYKVILIKRFTSIPGYIPIELTQINKDIFSIVYFDYNQYLAVFYQIQSQVLIPYFQAIKLGKKIAESYVRKSQDNGFVIRDVENQSKLIEYDVRKNAQIISQQKTEESLELTFFAENFDFEQINTTIRLQIEIIGEEEFYNQEQLNLLGIFLSSFCGLIILLILLLVARYIRRYWLLKSFNQREKKKFDEEKLESY